MKIGKATGDLTGRKLLQIVCNKVEYIWRDKAQENQKQSNGNIILIFYTQTHTVRIVCKVENNNTRNNNNNIIYVWVQLVCISL